MMVCEYITIKKNGVELFTLDGVKSGDTLTVTVMESLTPGYEFDEWQDENGVRIEPQPQRIEGEGDPTFNITVYCGWTYNAAFRVKPIEYYSVVLHNNDTDLGYVEGGGLYEEGDTVVIRAIAYDNCCTEFLGWYENDVPLSSEATYVFNSLDLDHVCEARFEQIDITYNVGIVGCSPELVEITANQDDYVCGDTAVFTVTDYDEQHLIFDGWYVNGEPVVPSNSSSGSEPFEYSFIVDCSTKDDVIEAHFTPIVPPQQYNINLYFDLGEINPFNVEIFE